MIPLHFFHILMLLAHMLFYFITFYSAVTITAYSCPEAYNIEGSLLASNISLKCEGVYQETPSIYIGETVNMFFEAGYSSHYHLGNTNHFHCFWVFKPIHEGNYIELYVNEMKSTDCHVSYLEVSVSGMFTEKICNAESIEAFKFIGTEISLKYNCIDIPSCYNRLGMTMKETSPVNPGCDFKMSEIGFRYYLMYDLSDIGLPSLEYATKWAPEPGMIINHVRYTLSFVNRENPGLTACFQDQIIVPKEDVPSCHSSLETNCGWDIVDGVQLVNEIYELKGSHWKIQNNGLFKTKSQSIQIEALCMYLEYFMDSPSNNASAYVYGLLPAGKVLITEHHLLGGVWSTDRIISPLPDYLKGSNIQLLLEIVLSGSIYINKIYGCNPYSMDDHILISEGNSITLYGTFAKDSHDSQLLCTNGGKYVGKECVCPVGFSGSKCEIGCGENKFGHDCGSQCSLFRKGCKQVIFCDDILGCSCAPGFKGLYCHTECAEFEFGANCNQKCGHCKDLKKCDIYTGYCKSGCKKGYKPPLCVIKLVHFITPPATSKVSFREVTIFAAINNQSISGFGEPSQFEIQLMDLGSKSPVWKHVLQKLIPADNRIMETIINLKASTSYKVRIILWMKPNQQGFDGDEVPSVEFHTPCRDVLDYKIKVYDIKMSEASLAWEKAVDDSVDCKVDQFLLSIMSGWSSVNFVVNTTNYKFTNLLSDTVYRVRVKPLLNSDPPYSSVTFTTLARCTGEVNHVEILYVGSTKVHLKWNKNSPNNNRFKVKYECQRILADEKKSCREDKNTLNISSTELSITSLLPFREYLVSVSEECEGSTGSTVVQFVTNIGVPYSRPEGGKIVEIDAGNATFQWSPPNDCSLCNGHITGYHIEVVDTSLTSLQTGFVKDNHLELQGLMTNMPFLLHVFYVNDAGWNTTAYMAIPFTIPAKNHL